MKQVNLALAFLLGCTIPSFAQGDCSFSSNTSASEFCSSCSDAATVPSRDIVNPDRELTGTLSTTNGNAKLVLTIPNGCAEGSAYLIGALTLNIGDNDEIRFDDDIAAAASATDFDIVVENGAKKALIEYGNDVYELESINEDHTFAALITRIRGEARSLPVELSSWTADASGGVAHLKWSTVLETDNDYFLLERSSDGMTFSELARIAGKGNTDGTVAYAYTDAALTTGTTYYRLSQFDYDGTRTTFEVRSVTVEGTARASVFPNPARAGDRITFAAPASAEEIVLHSITGREMGRYTVGSDIVLPADLPAGLYLLRGGDVTTRLLIRR